MGLITSLLPPANGTFEVAPALTRERTRLSKGVIGTSGRPAVALRFDDDHEAFEANIYPLLKARGLPAGFASISDLASQSWSDGVTPAQILNWNKYGVEIWSHGADHRDPRDPAAYDLEGQIVGSKETIESWGVKCQGWMHPGATPVEAGDPYGTPGGFTQLSDFDTPAGRLMLENYPLTEHYMGGTFRFMPSHGALGLDHVTISDGATLASAIANLDLAIRRGYGIEFMVHSKNLGLAGNMTLAEFTTFLDRLVTDWNAGTIDMVTPSGLLFADPTSTERIRLVVPTEGRFEGGTTNWLGLGDTTLETSGGPNGTTNFLRFPPASTAIPNQRFMNLDRLFLQGETFVAEAWARSNGAGTTTAQLMIQSYPSTEFLNVAAAIAPSSTWQRVRLAFTLPPASTGSTELLIGIRRTSGDGVDWGDIQVYKV